MLRHPGETVGRTPPRRDQQPGLVLTRPSAVLEKRRLTTAAAAEAVLTDDRPAYRAVVLRERTAPLGRHRTKLRPDGTTHVEALTTHQPVPP